MLDQSSNFVGFFLTSCFGNHVTCLNVSLAMASLVQRHINAIVWLCLLLAQDLASCGDSIKFDKATVSNDALTTDKPLSILLLNGIFAGHLFPLVSLGEELVKRGHNVTLCSTVMNGSKLLPNVPESVGVKFLNAGYDSITQEEFNQFARDQKETKTTTAAADYITLARLSTVKIINTLDTIGIDQFDIIVCDFSVMYLGLHYAVLGRKVIAYSSMLPPYPAIESPWPLPFTLSGVQTENLSFLDRLQNSIVLPLFLKFWPFLFWQICKGDARLVETLSGIDFLRYPGIHIPHLITSAVGFDIPTLRTPLRHYVGPVLKTKTEKLDEELEEWLGDKEDKTVIYISMGTTGFIPRDMAQAVVEGVMGARYSAVWTLRKDNREVLEGIEIDKERILILGWVPQQTILKHRAVGLSILHCGLNSVQETLYNGLPVVCLPHAFDHFASAGTIRNKEVGLSLYSFVDSTFGRINVSGADITEAIQTVTTDKYVENAKTLSLIYKFAGGAKRAADLVEFYEDVGYDHLIPAFAKYNWSWVQYYNVDVYAILIVLLCTLLYCGYRCIKCACCCFCRQKPNSASKAKTD